MGPFRPSLREVYSHTGGMGLVCVLLGLFGPHRRVAIGLRVFVGLLLLLLLVQHAVLFPLHNVHENRKDGTVAVLVALVSQLYAVVLAIALLVIVVSAPRVSTLFSHVVRPKGNLPEITRDLHRRSNAYLAVMVAVIIVSSTIYLVANDDGGAFSLLPVPLRVVLDFTLILVSGHVSVFFMVVARAALRFDPQGSKADVRRIIVVVVAVFSAIGVSSFIGLALLLTSDSASFSTVASRNTMFCLLVYLFFVTELASTLDTYGSSTSEDNVIAVRTAANNDADYNLAVFGRMALIAVGAALAFVVFIVPLIVTAGPVARIDNDTLLEQSSPPRAGLISAAIVFPLSFSTLVPILLSSLVKADAWPNHLFTCSIPTLVGMSCVFMLVPDLRYVRFVCNVAVFVVFWICLTFYVHRTRPEWSFLRRVTVLILVAFVVLLTLTTLVLPVFLSDATSDRTRLVIRLSVEIATMFWSALQAPHLERLGRHPAIVRPYLPFMMAAPFALLGRFLVATVDDIGVQFVSVSLIGLLEIFSVAFAPVLHMAISQLVLHKGQPFHVSVMHARRIVSKPIYAQVTLLHAAVEYVGILVIPVLFIVHAVVWYDGISYGPLVWKLFVSSAIQLAVELVADTSIVHIRARHMGIPFQNTFLTDKAWVVLVFTSSLSVVLGVAFPRIMQLCRRFVLLNS